MGGGRRPRRQHLILLRTSARARTLAHSHTRTQTQINQCRWDLGLRVGCFFLIPYQFDVRQPIAWDLCVPIERGDAACKGANGLGWNSGTVKCTYVASHSRTPIAHLPIKSNWMALCGASGACERTPRRSPRTRSRTMRPIGNCIRAPRSMRHRTYT